MTEYSVSRDFRSDTVTAPLPEMVQAIGSVKWGDSVYNEDIQTEELEIKVAKLTGKQAGLFCVSGTMSNQIGIRTNLYQPPYSIVCDYRAHIYSSEASALATLSQAMVTPVVPSNGVYVTLEDIKKRAILTNDIHSAPTKLISLENTLNGTIMPLSEVRKISLWARENQIKMHLDGARLWNAAAETKSSLKDWCQYFDSVSLCLSKGLCAPVGSVLVGSQQFIRKAKWFSKQQGGGIRQSGWLAAAANIGIDIVWPTMCQTHRRTRRLASELERMGATISLPVQTNFIFIDVEGSKLDITLFIGEAEKRGIKVWGPRIAIHYWTSDDALELLAEAFTAATRQKNPKLELITSTHQAYGLGNLA